MDNSRSRQELADKLDKELDEFMDTLVENRLARENPAESFDFDEWCKKIDKHPFFMTELKPDENGEYSEGVQALQALKYGDEASSPEELNEKAAEEKKQGNQLFQRKKYREAVEAYTQGIRVCCPDAKLNSTLYANRSAAHKYLGNFRSAFKDCIVSVKYDPFYIKAILRGGECLLELKYGKECVEWLDKNLSTLRSAFKESDDLMQKPVEESDIKSIEKLCAHARTVAAEEERLLRRCKHDREKAKECISTLVKQIKRRKINIPSMPLTDADPDEFFVWFEELKELCPQFRNTPLVYYDDEVEELVWPILIQYPEVGMVDVIGHCYETTPIHRLLNELLHTPAEWDPDNRYRPGNVQIFMDVGENGEVMKVNFSDNLLKVLSTPGVKVMNGIPVIQMHTLEHVRKYLRVHENNRMTFE